MASSEVISQVLFTSEQQTKNKMAFVGILSQIKLLFAVLSISFEVDVSIGKVDGSLLFECRRCELPRGVWGHAPPENFEI